MVNNNYICKVMVAVLLTCPTAYSQRHLDLSHTSRKIINYMSSNAINLASNHFEFVCCSICMLKLLEYTKRICSRNKCLCKSKKYCTECTKRKINCETMTSQNLIASAGALHMKQVSITTSDNPVCRVVASQNQIIVSY